LQRRGKGRPAKPGKKKPQKNLGGAQKNPTSTNRVETVVKRIPKEKKDTLKEPFGGAGKNPCYKNGNEIPNEGPTLTGVTRRGKSNVGIGDIGVGGVNGLAQPPDGGRNSDRGRLKGQEKCAKKNRLLVLLIGKRASDGEGKTKFRRPSLSGTREGTVS